MTGCGQVAKQKDTAGFKEVLEELKKGILHPLYVFEGDETYLKGKLLKAIETLLVEPSVKSLDYVMTDYSNNPSKVDFQQIQADLNTPPFLSKRKMVVIKNSGLFTLNAKSKKQAAVESEDTEPEEENSDTETPSSAKDRQSRIMSLLQSASEYSCLVFVEDKVDKRLKAIVEKIQEIGILASISKPDLREIRLWVRGEFLKKEIAIDPDVCDYLIDRNDGNLQNMVGEIEKLSLLTAAKGKNIIGKAEIDEIGSSDLKGSIFDIVDALSKNNVQEAYRLLELLLVQKQPIQLISFMLARHVRQLIIAKELGSPDAIIRKMKVIPFVANKLSYQAKNFTFDALEALYQECYESDLAVKTSKIQDKLALEILFASTVNKIQPDALIKKR